MKVSLCLTKVLLTLSILSRARLGGAQKDSVPVLFSISPTVPVTSVVSTTTTLFPVQTPGVIHKAGQCKPAVSCVSTITDTVEVFTGPLVVHVETVLDVINKTYTVTTTTFEATIIPTPASQLGFCELDETTATTRRPQTLTVTDTSTAVFFTEHTSTITETIRPIFGDTSECVRNVDPTGGLTLGKPIDITFTTSPTPAPHKPTGEIPLPGPA